MVLWRASQRKTSCRQVGASAQLCQSGRTSRLRAALTDSARALSLDPIARRSPDASTSTPAATPEADVVIICFLPKVIHLDSLATRMQATSGSGKAQITGPVTSRTLLKRPFAGTK